MKNDSPFFDSIRVKPAKDRRRRADAPACDWPKCDEKANHRAPKGRDRDQEYWHFCLDHVREYNHTYNFFAGMSDDAIARYQKDAVTGHRPTWKMGMNGGGRSKSRTDPGRFYAGDAVDPLGIFREFGDGPRQKQRSPEGRTVHNAQRKALGALGLEPDATRTEIKASFKALVKRHHPDANGGDRSSEEKLREIIQAYNYLKSVGAC